MSPIVQKVNEADLLIAAARKRDRWAPDTNFQNEQWKQHLRLLDTFIRCFEFLGFDVTIRGRKNFPVMLTYREGVLKVSSKTVA